MKITIQIPDETWDVLLAASATQKHPERSAMDGAARLVAQYADTLGAKPLVLSTAHVNALERILNFPLTNPDILLSRVQALSGVSVNGADLGLTPGQLAQLKVLADKRQVSVGDLIRQLLAKFMEQTFGLLGPAAP